MSLIIGLGDSLFRELERVRRGGKNWTKLFKEGEGRALIKEDGAGWSERDLGRLSIIGEGRSDAITG